MTDSPSPTIWVVIPTYWGPREGSPFDHPTPLGGESTLPRLLGSLSRQSEAPPFAVLILAATVDPAHAEQASKRLLEIAAPHGGVYPLAIAGLGFLQLVLDILEGVDLLPAGLDLVSYAGVRNLQLLVPAALGADLILALDDDEVVAPLHVARAVQSAEILTQRSVPFGLAGPYLDHTGSPFLPEVAQPAHLLEGKSAFMNQAVRRLIEGEDPYPVTPLALGGNMVFPRSLFEQIGFDPGITRGEDIDYLINARLEGFNFHFDRALAIEHLPPRHFESSAYAKLRHDVYRFVYQREKIRLAGLEPGDFDPYPGRLLREDFLEHARKALETTTQAEGDERWGSPGTVLEGAQAHAASAAPRYFEFARRWPEIVGALAEPEASSAIREVLETQGGLR